MLAVRIFIVALLASGCGESHPEGSPRSAAEQAEAQAFADAVAQKICERDIRCETRGFAIPYQDALECHPGSPFADRHPLGYEWWLTGFGTFDRARASACLAGLDEGCGGFESDANCNLVFHGTRSVGSMCTSWECDDTTAYCAYEGERTDPCAVDEGRCTALPVEGESCGLFTGCLGDLRCVDDVCRPRIPVGESCLEAAYQCGPDASCVGFVCESRYVGRGEACDESYDCADDLLCVSAAPGEPGTCGDGAAVGEACSEAQPCTLGHRCVDDACRAIANPGQSCADAVCSNGFWCSDGNCVPGPVLGESCTEAAVCVQGRCEGGTCTAIPEGASCGPGDPAVFGSCESGGCISPPGVCPIYVGEGEACDSRAVRCTRDAALLCTAEGVCEHRGFLMCG